MQARVLILGGYGMFGHRLWQQCHQQFETWATVRALRSDANHAIISGVDAMQLETVRRAFGQAQPSVVVNCIGMVKQRTAQSAEMLQVNARFPTQLAELCEAQAAKLIHLSTDCVFSGRRGNRSESDRPDPVDLYGGSKLLGEVARGNCLTIRTSMIGRETGSRYGLLEWFLSNAGKPVRGFTNAFFSGLTTGALADCVIEIIRRHRDLSGLWHVAGPRISKHDLLAMLRDAFSTDSPIHADASVTIDRSLNGEAFQCRTGWKAPSWQDMLAALAPAAALSGDRR